MRTAAAPQLVRPVGEARSAGLGVMGLILAMALAGLIGGLMGWAASEVASQQWQYEHAVSNGDIDYSCVYDLPDDAPSEAYAQCLDFQPWYGTNRTVGTIVFLGAFGVVLGAIVAGWDAVSARSPSKFVGLFLRSLAFLAGAVVIGGWIAEYVYEKLSADVVSRSGMHVPRGIAWSIFGMLLGLAIGASSLSVRRALQGAAGGLIGGFLGGFLFDFITLSDENGIVNRAVGLTITGVAIAVAISIIEVAARQHWLEIVSGGMAGKQFILHRDRTSVGSSPTCDVTLIKDPAMAPRHLQLIRQGQKLEAQGFDGSTVVNVNGTPISHQRLNDGDLIQIGSTVLRYRSRQQQMPTGMPLPSHAAPQPTAGYPSPMGPGPVLQQPAPMSAVVPPGAPQPGTSTAPGSYPPPPPLPDPPTAPPW